MAQLSENEFKVLKYIYEKYPEKVPENTIIIESLSERDIASAVSYLEAKGILNVDKIETRRYHCTDEGKKYLSTGLPEHRLYRILRERQKMSLSDVQNEMGEEYRIALAQLAKFGIVPVSGYITYRKDSIEDELLRREEFLNNIEKESKLNEDLLDHFKKRKNVIEEKKENIRVLSLTKEGVKEAETSEYKGGISDIDSAILSSGKWKGMPFRKYDLNAPVNVQKGALKHPLT
ncbi:MAG: phenylalanine--tRNA ligase subunit alpha, partial [Thermoplasmata archaeon]